MTIEEMEDEIRNACRNTEKTVFVKGLLAAIDVVDPECRSLTGVGFICKCIHGDIVEAIHRAMFGEEK